MESTIRGYALKLAKSLDNASVEGTAKTLELARELADFALNDTIPTKALPENKDTTYTRTMRMYALNIVADLEAKGATFAEATQILELTKKLHAWINGGEATTQN